MSGDVVRVRLTDGYYEHEQFGTVPQSWWSERDVYEVPRDQVERWQAAQDAWETAQREMAGIMDARLEQTLGEQAAKRARDDARRAEIRAGLYGRRKP